MGCHTWFYKKIEGPTQESIVSVVKKRVSKELEFLNRLINDRDSIDSDLLEAYPEWNKEYAEKNIPLWQTIYDFANGEDIDLSIFPEDFFEEDVTKDTLLQSLYTSWVNKLTVFIKEKEWYEDVDDFHDLFRKYGYPDDMLFSLEETLEYINDPKNECTVYEYTENRLKEFWEKYPDGMIQFG